MVKNIQIKYGYVEYKNLPSEFHHKIEINLIFNLINLKINLILNFVI